jgi:UDP-hydrolysing UDP-N-acetyl-D-glucosamine 2-epimerase
MTSRIAVVTATRAEYGLLRPVMRALREEPRVQLFVVATGAHLMPSHGMTVDDLVKDGFAPARRVDIVVAGDSRTAMGKSVGLATISFVDVLADLAPDCVVVLGDRYEMLAVVTAAMMVGIPVAHIEGGHVTEGAIDDSIRHAITKMSHLHLTAAPPYAQRLCQMGEDPSMVHVVGATGLDNALSGERVPVAQIEARIGISLERCPLFLVTHHPLTADLRLGPAAEIEEVLAGLGAFREASMIFTGANADPGGEAIAHAVAAFVAQAPDRRALVSSLGVGGYMTVAELADAVVGNSSSGLIEMPSLGIPTVNIGDRQKGRLRAPSVIDVPAEREAIERGVREALSERMRAIAARRENPMGDGKAGLRIARILAQTDFGALGAKRFIDLPVANLESHHPTASAVRNHQ